MVDQRVTRLAEVLVDHSVRVQKGENVYLQTDSWLAMPLVQEVYRLIIRRGGHPYPHIGLNPNGGSTDRIFMEEASDEQIDHLSAQALVDMQAMHCYIGIGASENTRHLSGIDPTRISRRQKATRPVTDARLEKRWVVTRYPTNAMAQEADMGLAALEDFYYGAALVDYNEMYERQRGMKEAFDQGADVRIVAPETDLSLSIRGRVGRISWGRRNVPDGEFYFAPVEDSAKGVVAFTYPAIWLGNEVGGVKLRFSGGKVVDASAERNEALLVSMLDTDDGARRLGEFGIGTNYAIGRFMKNMLFDEKMGGTVHLAVGNAYKATEGTFDGSAPENVRNQSAIHWDMLVDLREMAGGGQLYLDGRCVQQDGKFLI